MFVMTFLIKLWYDLCYVFVLCVGVVFRGQQRLIWLSVWWPNNFPRSLCRFVIWMIKFLMLAILMSGCELCSEASGGRCWVPTAPRGCCSNLHPGVPNVVVVVSVIASIIIIVIVVVVWGSQQQQSNFAVDPWSFNLRWAWRSDVLLDSGVCFSCVCVRCNLSEASGGMVRRIVSLTYGWVLVVGFSNQTAWVCFCFQSQCTTTLHDESTHPDPLWGVCVCVHNALWLDWWFWLCWWHCGSATGTKDRRVRNKTLVAVVAQVKRRIEGPFVDSVWLVPNIGVICVVMTDDEDDTFMWMSSCWTMFLDEAMYWSELELNCSQLDAKTCDYIVCSWLWCVRAPCNGSGASTLDVCGWVGSGCHMLWQPGVPVEHGWACVHDVAIMKLSGICLVFVEDCPVEPYLHII